MPATEAMATRARAPRNIGTTRRQRVRRAVTDIRNKLTVEQKTQVVQRLAGYESTAAIAKWLREECGIRISRQGIEYYDPTSSAGGHCAERWKALFVATRDAINAGRAEVGAAHRMVRVRWLDAMVHAAMDKGSFALAAKLLAQVAKEMNDWDKNRPAASRDRDITESDLARRIAAAAAAVGLVPARRPSPGGTR